MRISASCAKCLYDRQLNKTDNKAYLVEIWELLDNRKENDTREGMYSMNFCASVICLPTDLKCPD